MNLPPPSLAPLSSHRPLLRSSTAFDCSVSQLGRRRHASTPLTFFLNIPRSPSGLHHGLPFPVDLRPSWAARLVWWWRRRIGLGCGPIFGSTQGTLSPMRASAPRRALEQDAGVPLFDPNPGP
jgi:hypothetical protein